MIPIKNWWPFFVLCDGLDLVTVLDRVEEGTPAPVTRVLCLATMSWSPGPPHSCYTLVTLLYVMSTPSRGRGETQVSVGRRTVVTFLGDDVRTLSWS